MYEGIAPDTVTLMKQYIEIDELVKFLENSPYIWLCNSAHNFTHVNRTDKSYKLEKSMIDSFLLILRKQRTEIFDMITE